MSIDNISNGTSITLSPTWTWGNVTLNVPDGIKITKVVNLNHIFIKSFNITGNVSGNHSEIDSTVAIPENYLPFLAEPCTIGTFKVEDAFATNFYSYVVTIENVGNEMHLRLRKTDDSFWGTGPNQSLIFPNVYPSYVNSFP